MKNSKNVNLVICFLVMGTSLCASENPEGNEGPRKENSSWFSKVNPQHKQIIAVTGVGLAACAVGHLVVTPLLVSVACGFAVEQPCIKDTILEKLKLNRLDLKFRGMSDGLYDGLAYFGLSFLSRAGWLGLPVHVGLFIGQMGAICVNKPGYCRQIVRAWKFLRREAYTTSSQPISTDGTIVPPESFSEEDDPLIRQEMMNRGSTAILTWLACAGLTGKFGSLRGIFT